MDGSNYGWDRPRGASDQVRQRWWLVRLRGGMGPLILLAVAVVTFGVILAVGGAPPAVLGM